MLADNTIYWVSGKESVMSKILNEEVATSSAQSKAVFSKEELLALSEAIKKSKAKINETKAQSCAYHR
ncbi:hypothetical protein PS862_04534 [Pseudomonas fluorescens]|uniref:Uncharacterized protein n=2 Tax=Pseudomonas fluorescens TaxID=294 RepID=A0A5E7NAM1_PSEFL|nr:hypothetical protein PS862_04534 [Pseudomonas fluorescens]